MNSEMEVGSKKFTDKNRCRELAMSSSFCRRIYTEVEEVGWEHLVKLGEDLTFIRFRIMIREDAPSDVQSPLFFIYHKRNYDMELIQVFELCLEFRLHAREALLHEVHVHLISEISLLKDNTRRTHILEITLDKSYPRSPPSVSADVPYISHLEWSSSSKLRDVVQQFQKHVDKLQDFWLTLDDIDRSFWVIDPKHSHHAVSYRQIKIGHDCCIVLSVNVDDPRSLPECRFLGSDTEVNILRDIWKQNCKKWTREKSCPENLLHIFGNQLPQPSHLQKNEEQVECGICYAQYLPTDDELGAKSGTATDYSCENGNCNRAFHSVCLCDWLFSITTTRQSFDVLFGNCPYCSDPVAVKLSMKK